MKFPLNFGSHSTWSEDESGLQIIRTPDPDLICLGGGLRCPSVLFDILFCSSWLCISSKTMYIIFSFNVANRCVKNIIWTEFTSRCIICCYQDLTKNMAIAKALKLDSARRRTIVMIVLGCLWPILYCACALTAIFQLLVEILTSPLDSSTPISSKGAILLR